MSERALVRSSRLPERDLDDIATDIALHNPERAESFANEIEARCHRIAEPPRSFPLRPDLRAGLRVAVHGTYLILLVEEADGIVIARILHGRRNLRRLLRP